MSKRGEKMQAEVLAVLRQYDRPLSAYDVLRELREGHPKIAPPTVYNALAALTKKGHAHRIESLKSFIACQCDDHHHDAILSICNACGAVEESVSPAVLQSLSKITGKSGFAPMRHVIEVHGLCASCVGAQGPQHTPAKKNPRRTRP
ncbi:MAG: Fur family transcriptional regulator [Pseudomonadota bacterium]